MYFLMVLTFCNMGICIIFISSAFPTKLYISLYENSFILYELKYLKKCVNLKNYFIYYITIYYFSKLVL